MTLKKPLANYAGSIQEIASTDDWGTPNSILFNTGATVATPAVGQLWWDGTNTLELQMSSAVTMQIGQDSYFYVKASSAISIGQLCMFTGTVGSSGVITAAPSTGIANGQYVVGIAAENIALNGFGLIQWFGGLKGFDTTGSSVGETWANGDILYYNSAYTGGLTKVFPATGPIVTVAAVVNAGTGGSGSVVIRPSVTQRINVGTGLSISQTFSGTSLSDTAYSIVNQTANYTATSSDGTISVDATSAGVTITLPTAVGISGKIYVIKKVDSSANSVTVATTSSQTIDGSTTYTMGYQWQSITVQSNGSNWLIIAERIVATWQAIK